MIDTILFDAEGVVVDTEPAWDRGQEEFLRRRGCPYERERVKPLLTGRSLEEGVAVLQGLYGFGGDVEQLARERAGLVREAFTEEVDFLPGFPAFFDSVREIFKTGLATAMDPDLLDLLDRRLGLRDLFAGRVYTLAQGDLRGKPHPDLFLQAAAGLHSEPGQCLVIEDAPHGIEAARRAGMRCYGLASTYGTAKLCLADRIFDDFSQIPLDRLSS
jgi:HAD superfamily hydrolase (TIGR01509 family)